MNEHEAVICYTWYGKCQAYCSWIGNFRISVTSNVTCRIILIKCWIWPWWQVRAHWDKISLYLRRGVEWSCEAPVHLHWWEALIFLHSLYPEQSFYTLGTSFYLLRMHLALRESVDGIALRIDILHVSSMTWIRENGPAEDKHSSCVKYDDQN